jgi:hypothetical protein
MPRELRFVVVMVLLALVAACGREGSGPPPQGPPVDPRAAGDTVEVGGWYPVDTFLVGTSAEVNKTGDRQSSGWSVTVISPGDCTTDAADPAAKVKEVICVGLEIGNNSAEAGGLRLFDDLPVLSNSAGEPATVIDLRIVGMDFILSRQTGSVATSSNCTFSTPDAQGRQKGDCTAIVVFSADGGEVATGWATVGAGKTARYDLQYMVPPGMTGWAMRWPGGTWFALP